MLARTITDPAESALYFDRHVAETKRYNYHINPSDKDYMFDVMSFSTWCEIFDIAKIETSLRSELVAVDLLARKKDLKLAGKKIKSIFDAVGNSNFVRTDIFIDSTVYVGMYNGTKFNGMKRSLTSLSKDRINITNSMIKAQFFSPIPKLVFFVQERPAVIGKPIVFHNADVIGGKISCDDKESMKIAKRIVEYLHDNKIRPRHPQMSEGVFDDYTFSIKFTRNHRGDLVIFNCSLKVYNGFSL